MRLPLPSRARQELPGRGIAVVGMHRSGTSCLTGTLQAAGVHLGEVWRENPHNAKGNRESPRVVALNDGVLAANGGNLYTPPQDGVRWSRRQRRERDAILRALAAGGPVWGFKDPRTLLVLDGWLEGFPALEFAGSIRSPGAVADSLRRREGLPFAEAVATWEAYNTRLLALHDRRPFPLVCFDVDDVAYRAIVARMLDALGLEPVEDALAFFEPGLRQATATGEDEVPEPAQALYAELRRRALT